MNTNFKFNFNLNDNLNYNNPHHLDDEKSCEKNDEEEKAHNHLIEINLNEIKVL